MCGGKGQSTQTSQQQQTTTPNPYIAGAGQQAIGGAEYAAGLPFQMPVAPLAPFTPYQLAAQQGTAGAVGMAQPYFGAGANYLTGSAAPVTGQDVANYYNPMAGSVMAGMQDVFGQQMSQATRDAIQRAGGVGADRIAVAQANLAKQQGLAAGQTMAGLYYPALQAAQQQKQMMAGAGYGLGQMGPAAQAAQLQSLQALSGAGSQQQAMSQAYLNSLYQQRLAQIGYPFQTPQYLAGITGGLAPAMGGTTSGVGTSTYTPAQPSPFAQALGIGTSLVGLGMGMPGLGSAIGGGLGSMFGGNAAAMFGSNKGAQGGGYYGPAGAVYPGPGYYKSGGRIPMADGGLPPMPAAPGAKYLPAPIGQSATVDPKALMTTPEAEAEAQPFMSWYGQGAPGMASSPYAMGASGIPVWAEQQIGRMTDQPPVAPIALPPQAATAQRPLDHFHAMKGSAAYPWHHSLGSDSSNTGLGWLHNFGFDRFRGGNWATGDAGDSAASKEGGAVHFEDYGQSFQDGGVTPTPMPSGDDDDDDDDGDVDINVDQYANGGEVAPGEDPYGVGNPPLYGDYPARPSFGLGDIPGGGDVKSSGLLGESRAPEGSWVRPGSVLDRLFGPKQVEAETRPAAAPAAAPVSPQADVPMPRPRPDIAGPPGQAFRSGPPMPPVSRESIQQDVIHAANEYGIPPNIALRLINRESRFNPNARGQAGEIGLGQLMPGTAREVGVNPYSIPENIEGSMRYLRKQYDLFHDWHTAAMAYNAGPKAVTSGRIPDSSRAYADDVTSGQPIGATADQPMPTASSDPSRYMMPRSQMPFPGAVGPNSPVRGPLASYSGLPMALIKAGATMMSTPGGAGTVIGSGLKAGVGSFEAERKTLDSEEAINQKAASLYEHAMTQLDRYNMMTPYEHGRLGLAENRAEAARNKAYADARSRAVRELKIKNVDPYTGLPKPITEDDIEAATHKYLPGGGEENAHTITQSGSAADPILNLPPKSQLKQGLYYKLPDKTIRAWDGKNFGPPI